MPKKKTKKTKPPSKAARMKGALSGKVEWRAIEKVIPYASNPRVNEATVSGLAASITEFGWNQPILVDEHGIIVVGHTRLKAAYSLGYKKVPVVHNPHLTPAQVKAYRIVDNGVGEQSDWQPDLLGIELSGIEDLGFDLSPFDLNFDLPALEDLGGDGGGDGLPGEPAPFVGAGFTAPAHRVLHGDCLELLRAQGDATVDACVTDPPSGIAFMGAEWDKDKGGRVEWIAWLASVFVQVLRVLKPGGHALVWALPRTSHWTATALEEAGFEVRDSVHHCFGSGFPKGHDVSKAIDKAAGVEPLDIVPAHGHGAMRPDGQWNTTLNRHIMPDATTPEAKQWEGWNVALKPGHEVWWLVRKPFASTVAENVLQYGTGALNVDACRVGDGERHNPSCLNDDGRVAYGRLKGGETEGRTTHGRWPSNFILTHSAACALGDGGVIDCAPGCPVAELDAQSGISKSTQRTPSKEHHVGDVTTFQSRAETSSHNDSGGASRFFNVFAYIPKPSTGERDLGLESLPTREPTDVTGRKPGSAGQEHGRAGITARRANIHPTVKAEALMRWLVRLITPPGGVVLDPFTGSGTTGVACVHEGVSFLGMEQSEEYASIARRRIKHAQSEQQGGEQR